MPSNALRQREREIASYLLDAAWLTDGGKLFVKREVFEQMPGVQNADIAFRYAKTHNFVEQTAVLTDVRIPLNRKILERDANREFTIKNYDHTEFSNPETIVALRLLAARTGAQGVHIAYSDGTDFYITKEALDEIDPHCIGRKNGWVGEKQVYPCRTMIEGKYHVSRAILESVVGISHKAACGEEIGYNQPAKKSRR